MIYLTIYLCIKRRTICIDIVGPQMRAIVGQTRVTVAIGPRDVITSAAALAAASGLADAAAASAKAVRI
jgi:hypothetical protein